MKTMEGNEVSLKPEIDEAFEEFLGSNIFEDEKNHQMLEKERIAAMIQSIEGRVIIPNLNTRVVFYQTKAEPTNSNVTDVFLFKKKEDKRPVQEIMSDIFDEEFFCDYFDGMEQALPVFENLVQKPEKKEVVPFPVVSTNTIPSPVPAVSAFPKKIWNVYIIDSVKKVESAIEKMLDFNFHWNFNWPREMIATSAYAALCVFVSIPFGIVAAEKLDLPINSYFGIESRVQETAQPQPKEQPKIEVQVGDQIVQLPTVPQPGQNVQQSVAQHQPMPQNKQISTPGNVEATNYNEYTQQPQTEYEQQSVYPNTETYEPVYNYSYTETTWAEPVNEPETKIDNTVPTGNIPEATQPIQTASNTNEIPKPEPKEPVAPPVVESVPQNKPVILDPLPSSDAFMRPVSPAAPTK